MSTTAPRIPGHEQNDYTRDVAAHRREFLRERTEVSLEHVGQHWVTIHERLGRNR